MSKIHVYHHNDHDGIVAAGVLYNQYAKNNYKDEDIIFYMIDYDKELNFDHIDLNTDEVYFLDYSFSSPHNLKAFEELLDRRPNYTCVTWIDHHKTSIGVFEDKHIPGKRNAALCGAAWAYLYTLNASMIHLYVVYSTQADMDKEKTSKDFHDNPIIPKFIKLIDDYDCWKKLYSYTNDFHYGLTISSPTDDIINSLLSDEIDDSANIAVIIKYGSQIQKFLEFENREYHVNMYGFEYTLPEEHGGLKCFCMNRKGNSIMFGDKIDEYDAVIPFFYVNGKWKYSIFSNKENIDCSEVAKTYGGGGHKGAAGWITDKLIFE